MPHIEANVTSKKAESCRGIGWSRRPADPRYRFRRASLSVIFTLAVIAFGIWAGHEMWASYMGTPWTRDGTVRAYVVSVAPEVSGRIVDLPVADNQYVRKGDPLLTIEPTDYAIAVQQAEAEVDQARANAENAEREATRRQQLSDLAASQEQRETFTSTALSAKAMYRQSVAKLTQARVNLQRTSIRSPVNGYVANLATQRGDYAMVGKNVISLVDADSFWVDGYFEEIYLGRFHSEDPALVKLMGRPEPLQGHVESIARGITVANAEAGPSGLAKVNPIYTWVRLAQRIPVRIHIDYVPAGVVLVAGQTATIEIGSK
ncbi:multidrug resistance efflux pump [Bradyrhizobium japonicum]|uniref:efflux RND transporter periplasmic adaptor subunit n=1 Tax=Bradyrhizobium japonicum TaxID=375 RepID=UPI002167CBBE|nr:HlyD family secretion protein [Bradyrhizobium japonicum]MCS3496154.1 multidrug resistance efflux pump [Bradyrhizobium japonicum]MCS3961684.1 multidrug resistance efflux pump [Bradyrhizobium japonicum]MCS3994001.1 multidrug resistance efflux pump [Bradyrhizobium japonicum]